MAPVEISVILDKAEGDIELSRALGKFVGNNCCACKKQKTISDLDLALIVRLTESVVILCPFHEGMMIERLLTNYVKRMRRGSKIGFIGDIEKETK